MTVEEARAARVCRLCGKPISLAGGAMDVALKFRQQVYPERITFDFGAEFAHTACLKSLVTMKGDVVTEEESRRELTQAISDLEVRGWIDRQTNNLMRFVEAHRLAQHTPQGCLSVKEQGEVGVETGASRCCRCGSINGAFLPADSLCFQCRTQLLARDQQDTPGCLWWQDLLAKAGRKSKS